MRVALLAGLVLLALVNQSCQVFQGAPIDPGADRVVVFAQRAQNQALDTFDEFLAFEQENRALLNDPKVKAAADNIRMNYQKWDDDLSASIKTYQLARTQENATKLDLTLSILRQAVAIASHYLVTKASVAPNWVRPK